MGVHAVFVSRPSAVTPAQQRFCDALEDMLAERGCAPRTLGRTDYPNKAPMTAVRELMVECEGAIVLGLRQIEVIDGIVKPGTDEERRVHGAFHPTAWNQLEAGVGFALDLPLMLIKEAEVEGGVFDAGNTDRFVHQAEMSRDWLRSPRFLQPFNEWLEEILKRS
jgi:hypothetical protein